MSQSDHLHREIRYGIFCESARSEANGKVSLLGIWGGRCVVYSAPPALIGSFAFHAYIYDNTGEPCEMDIEVTLPGRDEPVVLDATIEGDPGVIGHNLNINFGTMPMLAPGEVIVRVKLRGEPPASSEHRLEVVFRDSEDAGAKGPDS